jgi:hypothetical protein
MVQTRGMRMLIVHSPHRRDKGVELVMMNGQAVSVSSNCHSTPNTSTTGAELTEVFLASSDSWHQKPDLLCWGIMLDTPMVLY